MCIFDHMNNDERFTLVALPSGEVFKMNGMQFYNLYENDIIKFDNDRGFWFFDENRHGELVTAKLKR